MENGCSEIEGARGSGEGWVVYIRDECLLLNLRVYHSSFF